MSFLGLVHFRGLYVQDFGNFSEIPIQINVNLTGKLTVFLSIQILTLLLFLTVSNCVFLVVN